MKLKESIAIIRKERKFYLCSFPTRKRIFFARFTHQHQYELFRYIRLLRISEYFLDSKENSCVVRKLKTILFWLVERKRNKLGNRLGLCITQNVFGEGLYIDHIGSIVINPLVRVGKNCHIHGDCCIGLAANGKSDDGAPKLGNNVDIGWGAIIIGNIRIADNVTIGANSVVNKSIDAENSVWVGSPARRIR